MRDRRSTLDRDRFEAAATIARLEQRVAELEGGFRAILLEDYRGNRPKSHRIAELLLEKEGDRERVR